MITQMMKIIVQRKDYYPDNSNRFDCSNLSLKIEVFATVSCKKMVLYGLL